jgi:cellulose synthase/poly-beta-1,6-N-acetylglucosamine synthase-like glycosyltransferase
MIVWDNPFWFTSYILVFTALSAFGAHRIKVLYQFWKHRENPPVPVSQFAELPMITVQLPIFNELHVVGNLLRTVSALDYPRDRLQIQVLDDSTDETAAHAEKLAAELKAQGYDVDYRHRTNRNGFKAGALDEAMAAAKGDYICIFDADFQPQPDYLKKVIHHFTDPKVGMVQARWGHLNKDFSLLTRLQALFLDGHLDLATLRHHRKWRLGA